MEGADEQQLFVLTKRVREALDLINVLDESKLVVIVKRLVKNVGVKGAPFSAEELEQLQEHLQLGEGQVLTRVWGRRPASGPLGRDRLLVCRASVRAWYGRSSSFRCDVSSALHIAGGYGDRRLLLLPGAQRIPRDPADAAVGTPAGSGHGPIARPCILRGVGGRSIVGILALPGCGSLLHELAKSADHRCQPSGAPTDHGLRASSPVPRAFSLLNLRARTRRYYNV